MCFDFINSSIEVTELIQINFLVMHSNKYNIIPCLSKRTHMHAYIAHYNVYNTVHFTLYFYMLLFVYACILSIIVFWEFNFTDPHLLETTEYSVYSTPFLYMITEYRYTTSAFWYSHERTEVHLCIYWKMPVPSVMLFKQW